MIKILVYVSDLYWRGLLGELPYRVDIAIDEDDVYQKTYKEKFDFYLFDFENGYKVLEELRQSQDKTFAFFISSFEDFNSQKKAYGVANEFFKKSCTYVEEIKIKIDYYLKHYFNMGEGTIKYGDMFYNIKTKTLYKNNKKIELTPLENELLVLFFKNKNRYIPKCEILERFEIADGSLRVKLSNIRKLGFEIINNREYGYQLKEKK